MARLVAVVGARPNFVKVAPVLHALRGAPEVEVVLVHTGQHYDHALSTSFLDLLDMDRPRHFLDVGSGSHARQTAGVLAGMESVLVQEEPDAVLVPGDVNSTLAAALAATKLGVGVIHLEAGLRSRDWTMPEEVNRVLTDRMSDLLLCPSADAVENLRAEGIPNARTALVGNTMIDTLVRLLPRARSGNVLEQLELAPHNFVLVTLHRPSLVDDPGRLVEVLEVLGSISARLPVVFPVHPRTRRTILDMRWDAPGVALLDPLDYLSFLGLQASARVVVTDSGGVQEEASVLGVPCLTFRTTTERPITVELGTNRVVGTDASALSEALDATLDAPRFEVREIPFWDGRAGERAAVAVRAWLAGGRPGGVMPDLENAGLHGGLS